MMAGFSSSRFAFFKFARVNRKLPRSTLSGVTCLPYTPCEARLKPSTPQPPSGSTKKSPSPVPESPHFRVRNRQRIGIAEQPESDPGSGQSASQGNRKLSSETSVPSCSAALDASLADTTSANGFLQLCLVPC